LVKARIVLVPVTWARPSLVMLARAEELEGTGFCFTLYSSSSSKLKSYCTSAEYHSPVFLYTKIVLVWYLM
jgi:hypothetical protein